jgi:hypothetical protein
MAKPSAKPENHGQAVSAFVQELQAARTADGERGLGREVSAFAREKGEAAPDIEDGVITVVKADGTKQAFATFTEAFEFSGDGDTLYVGKGVYAEAVNLDEQVTIIGEEGAVIDASAIQADAGTQGAIQLFDGFSGGSISGLTVVSVGGGNALVSIIGEALQGVALTGNTFDAGANTAGSVVYLNPGARGVVIEGNSFEGVALTDSPLLGVEGDDVQVTDNAFGVTPGPYAKVEIFPGANGNTDDVVLTGNTGLMAGDVVLG